MAGRGFGKTRTGAETIRALQASGQYKRMGLIARTAADVRDVMVEGESGIMAISPPWDMPIYEPSKRRLTWKSGAIATTYSADEPSLLRGPQHDALWCDEVASWRRRDAWDNAKLGLRLGSRPVMIATMTPKPTPLVRSILEASNTVVTRGSTYENLKNLAPSFQEHIISQYEGTRLGRQELHAELLTDTPGALWTYGVIELHRVLQAPDLMAVVIAVDPAVTAGTNSNETGIIAIGRGDDGEGYVLNDYTIRGHPAEWAASAVSAYHKHEANYIVAESNQGGEMVRHTIHTVDPTIPVKLVRASVGKRTRAEPVAALYEQGKMHHVGQLTELEDQMCTWAPGDAVSPDRLDALVWGAHSLFVTGKSITDFAWV